MLKHSPSRILLQRLLDRGLVIQTRDGRDEHLGVVGTEPHDPPNCVTLYDTDPLRDGRLMEGTVIAHGGVQCRVRNKNYEEGWEHCHKIITEFETVLRVQVTVKDTRYEIQNISPTGGLPISIGPDENQRRLFTANFFCTIKTL